MINSLFNIVLILAVVFGNKHHKHKSKSVHFPQNHVVQQGKWEPNREGGFHAKSNICTSHFCYDSVRDETCDTTSTVCDDNAAFLHLGKKSRSLLQETESCSEAEGCGCLKTADTSYHCLEEKECDSETTTDECSSNSDCEAGEYCADACCGYNQCLVLCCDSTTEEPIATTEEPTTNEPTTAEPTTSEPTTSEPTTSEPTTAEPTTSEPTTNEPTTSEPTTAEPTTAEPTTSEPTTAEPTTSEPTTSEPTTSEPTTSEPTTSEPTTSEPTTAEPTTSEPTTSEPTTSEPTTAEPTTAEPTNTPEPTTDEYPETTSDEYPETTSDEYPETTSDEYPETTSDEYPETTSDEYPETTRPITETTRAASKLMNAHSIHKHGGDDDKPAGQNKLLLRLTKKSGEPQPIAKVPQKANEDGVEPPPAVEEEPEFSMMKKKKQKIRKKFGSVIAPPQPVEEQPQTANEDGVEPPPAVEEESNDDDDDDDDNNNDNDDDNDDKFSTHNHKHKHKKSNVFPLVFFLPFLLVATMVSIAFLVKFYFDRYVYKNKLLSVDQRNEKIPLISRVPTYQATN